MDDEELGAIATRVIQENATGDVITAEQGLFIASLVSAEFERAGATIEQRKRFALRFVEMIGAQPSSSPDRQRAVLRTIAEGFGFHAAVSAEPNGRIAVTLTPKVLH